MRQLGGELLHLGQRGTRAVAGRGAAADAHGGVAVVAHGLHGAGDPACAGKGGQRDSLALAVDDVELEQIVGLHAGRCVGLHHHALQAPSVGEVVHVTRPQGGGDHAVDGVIAHTQGAGLVAVNVHLQLRCVFQAVRPHLGQHLAFGGHTQQLPTRGQQGFTAQAGAVLQAQAEA